MKLKWTVTGRTFSCDSKPSGKFALLSDFFRGGPVSVSIFLFSFILFPFPLLPFFFCLFVFLIDPEKGAEDR